MLAHCSLKQEVVVKNVLTRLEQNEMEIVHGTEIHVNTHGSCRLH